MVLGGNFPQNSPNKIASAYIHIPRNNPAKSHDNPIHRKSCTFRRDGQPYGRTTVT